MYRQFESMNNRRVCELEESTRALNRNLASYDNATASYEGQDAKGCFDESKEKHMFNIPYAVNGSCVKIDTDYSMDNKCYGYDCDKGSFHHQPDRLNTYHNYLVLSDDGKAACTKNHQYFNNWTKRNDDTKQHAVGGGGLIFDPMQPIPSLTFRECVNPHNYVKPSPLLR